MHPHIPFFLEGCLDPFEGKSKGIPVCSVLLWELLFLVIV
ncbi:hypothetical protein ADIAL_2049 [Alkalibacterium sp. AK22]|nr:hypothetical protein ADIAL_2049 [Alkalibacterium sp. AK22]